jgi:hypothetical protein
MRGNLVQATGRLISSEATSNGTTTTVVDTAILKYNANVLKGKWLLILDATNTTINGTARQIASVSSSTITVTSAFAAATTDEDTYEILDWDPDLYHAALEQAVRDLGNLLYLPIVDESLVVDNLLSNHSFETWDGSNFTGWTASGTPTLSQNTTRPRHLSSSAALIKSGGSASIRQTIRPTIAEHAGKEVTLTCWVWTSALGRIGLILGNDSAVYSDYHTGDAQWKKLEVTSTRVSTGSDAVTAILETGDDIAGSLFDVAFLPIDPIYRYALPTSFVDAPRYVYQQVYEDQLDGLYLPLGRSNHPIAGRILRLEGMGRVTVPTTDAGTTEIDEVRSGLITAQAAANLYRILQREDPGNRALHERDKDDWDRKVARMAQGVRVPRMGANERVGWDVLDDSGTKYLTLTDWRG